MKENIVYFAHGKESGPWGTKIVALAKGAKRLGFDVQSPDYSMTMNPDERVKILLDLKPKAKKNLVLVGSSMGGYVSTVASRSLKVKGLFLLAPAFYKMKYANQDPIPHAKITTIIHGLNDDVVPVDHSIRFAKQYKAQLILLDSDHRLMDALPIVIKYFEIFLREILGKQEK